METAKDKRKTITKMKVLAVIFAIVVVSSGLTALFFQNLANKAKPVTTIRVACVGDSITEGTEYPNDLWMMLNASYRVENFGVGGSTVLLSSGKPYMNQTAFEKAKEYLPNIVVIMLGTNDASPTDYQHIESFVVDYEKLIGEFQSLASTPKIWLATPPPIFNNASGPNSVNLVQGVIPRIEKVANESGLLTVDVYNALVNHPEYFPADGVHPNDEGAKLIANLVFGAITPPKSG